MKTQKRKIGDIGEEIACKFLKQKGYTIVEQNYLKKWGEIDVVARKSRELHFVEVKTVQTSVSRETSPRDVSRETGYRPEDNVHPAKLKRLHRAIETYLLERKVSRETQWQLDIVTVMLDLSTKQAKVNLLENVILE